MERRSAPLPPSRLLKLLVYLILVVLARGTSPAVTPAAPLAKRQLQQRQLAISNELATLKALTTTRLPSSLTNSDYELSDLALLSAVDGSVFAIQRSTGRWVWTLHSEQGSIVGPLISSQTNVTSYSPGTLQPSNATAAPVGQQQEATADEVYVVEPAGGGAIFLHTKSTGETEKLPLTIAELVDLSPFEFPSDDSRMFVGKRTTSLVGIDLASGQLMGVFGPEAGWCEWNRKGSVRPTDECEDGIQARPKDMLYMGKTEYQLSILSKSEGTLLQSLSFTSYHPSSLVSTAQQASWQRTPDELYFQPLQDGSLLCLKTGQAVLEWATSPFPTPIVGVFDIVYPRDDENPSAQPIMLRQPCPIKAAGAFDALQLLPDEVYFGRLPKDSSHALYALSRASFPFFAFSGEDLSPSLECQGLDCLIGLHRLQRKDGGQGLDDGGRSSSSQDSHDMAPLKKQRPLGIDARPEAPADIDAAVPLNPPPLPLPALDSNTATTPLFPIYSAIIVSITALGLLFKFFRARRRRRLHFPSSITDVMRSWIYTTPTDDQLMRPLVVTEDLEVDSEKQALAEKDVPADPLMQVNKDLPPTPRVSVDKDEQSSSEEEEEPAKKRRGRRKRGKKPNQRLAEAAVAAATLDEGFVKVGSLVISDEVIGYGSHGTVVLKGTFQGRAVAVKRLLKDFVTIAEQEVSLLQDADEHANVIRYFCKEQRENFLYIALELCPASLADVFECPDKWPQLASAFDTKRALRQIASGVAHLHSLKIVHRDIKPQNILISLIKQSSKTVSTGASLRLLISDFGLCKKLDIDESSFLQTVNHAAGSFGYRAPEVLRGEVNPNETHSRELSSSSSRQLLEAESSTSRTKKLTRSLDIFSLGCIFYYVLTSGEHPFGGRFEREVNILKSESCLDRLDGLGEEAQEAQSLIASMISDDAVSRPSADAVLLHPFFWTSATRLSFLCEASDRFEIMERDPPEAPLRGLEARAAEVVGSDWLKRIDRSLVENLGKYRKYDGSSVRDLLRVIRNKRHHFLDLPETVRKSLGTPPDDFLSYFTQRFPLLFLHVWETIREHASSEPQFAVHYFGAAD